MLFLILTSCEKFGNKITGEFKVNYMYYYPDERIKISFEVKAEGGTAPYYATWINPDSLIGLGPFTFFINDNLEVSLYFIDTNKKESKIINYTFDFEEIKNDPANDYRYQFTGSYYCKERSVCRDVNTNELHTAYDTVIIDVLTNNQFG